MNILDESIIEDITSQISAYSVSSKEEEHEQESDNGKLNLFRFNDNNPRPKKRFHFINDSINPKSNGLDLDNSDEELKCLNKKKILQQQTQTITQLPTINEINEQNNNDIKPTILHNSHQHNHQNIDNEGMEFHSTAIPDNSYESKRKFLKRTSTDVYTMTPQEIEEKIPLVF